MRGYLQGSENGRVVTIGLGAIIIIKWQTKQNTALLKQFQNPKNR
jgi:hypothetical protein